MERLISKRIFTVNKTFGILTILFVILNLLTLSWSPIPWFDEVWFIDTAVNKALDGNWTTTAQLSFAGETPIALYPPLYQWLLTCWIWICGFSLFTVRAFNVLMAAGCSVIMYKGLREMGYLKKYFTLILFVFLFWGTGLFAWSYRNGRPDMVNLFCSLLFIYSYLLYVKNGNNPWWMLLTSILVLLSGLQACPFILAFVAYMYFVKKEFRKKTITTFLITVGGFTIGICVLWGHFVYYGHPKSFFWQFSHSATISVILHKIPFLSESVLPFKKISNSGHSVFYEFVDCYLRNKNYAILTIVNIFVLTFLIIKAKINRQAIEFLFLIFSLLIPTVMFLAGHCPSPYTWMFYFPALFLSIICLEHNSILVLKGIYGILIIGFTIIGGLTKTLINNDKSTYDSIVQFVVSQNFNKNVVILSSYSAYYPLREITRNSYYPVYPVQHLPAEIEYVLVDETDNFGYESLDSYLHLVCEKGYKVTPIDSLQVPKIVLYQVSK